jgi:RNA recognition motif-containing protein
MIKQIAVGNLPVRATENDVKALFADYGRVTSVLFRGSGTSRVAYVDLSSNVEADAALVGLRGARLGTGSLNVTEARPREER